MAEWAFLTSHARVLLQLARDPGARLRDIAASLGITERRAPVPEPGTREPAVREVVALFAARNRAGGAAGQGSGSG